MELRLTGISHTYDKKKNSLTNISLTLNNGITGLLGVNGAGKSSLLNILATVISPQTGEYTMDGINGLAGPGEIRNILGYLPQNPGYIPELSIYDFLQYSALLKGCSLKELREHIHQILESVNLLGVKSMKMKSLSGGMKQRVGIAQAIINNPKLLILDEPVVGLDPNERNNFGQLLSGLAKDAIIVLSSHIIDDIENMCEQVVLLDKGILQYSGQIQDLVQSVNGLVHEALISRERYENMKGNCVITKVKPVQDLLLVRYLSDELNGETVTIPSLEDAFIFKTQYSKS